MTLIKEQTMTIRIEHANMIVRDVDATMQFLATQNLGQMEARRFQTLSNVSKVAHEVAAGSVRNLK